MPAENRRVLRVRQLLLIAIRLVRRSDDDLWTVGLRRHASSSAQVPRIFVSSVETGFRFATPTVVCAARWMTVDDFVLAERALERLLIPHVASNHPDLFDQARRHELRARNPVAHEGHDVGAGLR